MSWPHHHSPSLAVAGSSTLLEIRGELDAAVVPTLRRAVLAAWSTAPFVDVDVAEVTFMDCAVLGALVGLSLESRAHGCSLRLQNLPEPVEWLVQHFDVGGVLLGGPAAPADGPGRGAE